MWSNQDESFHIFPCWWKSPGFAMRGGWPHAAVLLWVQSLVWGDRDCILPPCLGTEAPGYNLWGVITRQLAHQAKSLIGCKLPSARCQQSLPGALSGIRGRVWLSSVIGGCTTNVCTKSAPSAPPCIYQKCTTCVPMCASSETPRSGRQRPDWAPRVQSHHQRVKRLQDGADTFQDRLSLPVCSQNTGSNNLSKPKCKSFYLNRKQRNPMVAKPRNCAVVAL